MLTTRIIAVRHGETDWNASARIQGKRDIALNVKGRWQADRVAQALADAGDSVAAIYSSDLARAHDTARAIAVALELGVSIDPRLRERDFGDYEGSTFAELERQWPQEAARWRARDAHWAPPGGETLTVLGERVLDATRALAQNHPGEQIVLVAHGGVLDMMYRIATRQGVDAERNWALGNASINRLLWSPEGLSLVGWSDTSHLDASWRDETIT